MKIMIMTDMEGVTGVHDHRECCTETGRYYQTCRQLLTREVNAAIAGFCAAGAGEITVAIGHHYDSVDRETLDPRALMVHGHFDPIWPWGLDRSFDALAFVGQHAKAGSDHAHLAHTGSFETLDFRVNGISVGEYGKFSFCAMELGIPVIFAAGDRALAREAEALTPGVFTVSGKHGLIMDGGRSAGMTGKEYSQMNLAACHRSPQSVRLEMEQTAFAAVAQWQKDKSVFQYPDLKPPYCIAWFVRGGDDGEKPYILYAEDPVSYTACLNKVYSPDARRLTVSELPEGA